MNYVVGSGPAGVAAAHAIPSKGEVSYFHLIPFGLEKTVIDSQVIAPALELKKEGINLSLIVFESPFFLLSLVLSDGRKKIYGRLKGLPAIFLPRTPRNLFFANTILLGLFLLPFLLSGKRLVFQARGFQGTNYLLPLKKIFHQIRIMCDVRGIESEEYAYHAEPLGFFRSMWKSHLEKISRKALLESDVKFCVSKAMLKYLQEWVRAQDRNRWEHIPCSVRVDDFSVAIPGREEERQQRGLQDKLVVVYSGAYRNWQMPDETISLFKEIQALLPQAYFLCLTPDVGEFHQALQRAGVSSDSVHVEHVGFGEMGRHLACGDIGVLFREENPLNAFACPTKFPEYLASGLFILSTPAVRDIAELIREEMVGIVLNDFSDRVVLKHQLQQAIQTAQDVDRRQSKSVGVARRIYDWKLSIPLLKKWYLDLSSEK